MHDYEITPDDIGALLAVECTPMDDNGCKVTHMLKSSDNCIHTTKIFLSFYAISLHLNHHLLKMAVSYKKKTSFLFIFPDGHSEVILSARHHMVCPGDKITVFRIFQ